MSIGKYLFTPFCHFWGDNMRYYQPKRKIEKTEKEILPEWVVRLKEYFQNSRGEQKAERRDDMPRCYASK